MRIIAGRFRRRTLHASPGRTTRPITDRIKERLFAKLTPVLEDARVADVFAGTGTIGLEALSRDASRVVFVEKDRAALRLLRENIAALDVEEETLVWAADVFRCSFRPQAAEAFTPLDLIFFDPPYPLVTELAPGRPLYKSLERLAGETVSAAGAWLVLRTPDRSEFAVPAAWVPDWEFVASGMQLGCYVKAAPPDTGEAGTDPEAETDPEAATEPNTSDAADESTTPDAAPETDTPSAPTDSTNA